MAKDLRVVMLPGLPLAIYFALFSTFHNLGKNQSSCPLIPFPEGDEASVAYDLLQHYVVHGTRSEAASRRSFRILGALRHDGNDDVSTYWELAGRYMTALTVWWAGLIAGVWAWFRIRLFYLPWLSFSILSKATKCFSLGPATFLIGGESQGRLETEIL